MKPILNVRALGMILSLLLLCSCATASQETAIVSATKLPAKTVINKSAGRGGWLYVMLHLKDGEDLRFVLDTGSPYTVLEKSLVPKLGKQLGGLEIPATWYATNLNLYGYRSPKLYLGNTRLFMGDWILAGNFQVWDGPHVSGILGMDCLRHYCIQLDFTNGEIQFLDPDNLKTDELGKAFPITYSKEGYADIPGALAQADNAVSKIDTGMPPDGALTTELFDQELKKRKGAQAKEIKTATGVTWRYAWFSEVAFADKTYTNVTLAESSEENIIGLRFLARHLATFNFPKRTMYLKQINAGPLVENKEKHFNQ